MCEKERKRKREKEKIQATFIRSILLEQKFLFYVLNVRFEMSVLCV